MAVNACVNVVELEIVAFTAVAASGVGAEIVYFKTPLVPKMRRCVDVGSYHTVTHVDGTLKAAAISAAMALRTGSVSEPVSTLESAMDPAYICAAGGGAGPGVLEAKFAMLSLRMSILAFKYSMTPTSDNSFLAITVVLLDKSSTCASVAK